MANIFYIRDLDDLTRVRRDDLPDNTQSSSTWVHPPGFYLFADDGTVIGQVDDPDAEGVTAG